ncbi:hypothetical protein [Opitutus terrae]|uniref:Uncharacterized protein n=1 Tax=Opitutus terrae (strain DSM 11246 / JCM 15787 / PB90-1) TaxID=452637 RepID=B1ZUA6_OPITP|nr:hypothetical protein [Opitutus terrae]ACB76668.1 hypothetical protein Oter_3391 [Opitutus terrae PB90-1]
MSLDDLRKLADWHADQASACEFLAENHERCGNQATGACMRELGQWHASTAIHVRELADAFAQLFTAISPVTPATGTAPSTGTLDASAGA